MKTKGNSFMQRMVRTMLVGMITILATTALSAQDVTVASAKPFYKPGDTIRISIAFDGPDVTEIVAAQVTLQNFAPPEQGQKGFDTAINGGESKRISPNSFEVDVKVPEVAASGDYRLQRIWITFPSGRPAVNYYMESDFQEKLVFHVENRKHFENPKIKSIRELR